MNIDRSYDFPLTSAFTNEQVQQHFWKCLYTSAKQEKLHYWVILPQKVKPAELDPIDFHDVGLTNIGRYVSPDKSPYLEIWAAYEHCPWEMNASDWLFNKLSLMGEKILHQRILDNPSGSGKFADVLTTKTQPSGEEVISRYTVQKDYNPKSAGGNYFLLKASCASGDYPALADDIYTVVVNWDLLHRSHLGTAELLTTINLNADSSFKVPASWRAKNVADNRLLVEHTIKGINYGVINIYFYSKPLHHSPEQVFNKSVERFYHNENSVTLTVKKVQRIINNFNDNLDQDVYTCIGDVFSATENMRAFYQMFILSHADLWVYIELVGKNINHKEYHYEANKRCLELVLSTININVKTGQ